MRTRSTHLPRMWARAGSRLPHGGRHHAPCGHLAWPRSPQHLGPKAPPGEVAGLGLRLASTQRLAGGRGSGWAPRPPDGSGLSGLAGGWKLWGGGGRWRLPHRDPRTGAGDLLPPQAGLRARFSAPFRDRKGQGPAGGAKSRGAGEGAACGPCGLPLCSHAPFSSASCLRRVK